jgi:hypothetical protein
MMAPMRHLDCLSFAAIADRYLLGVTRANL